MKSGGHSLALAAAGDGLQALQVVKHADDLGVSHAVFLAALLPRHPPKPLTLSETGDVGTAARFAATHPIEVGIRTCGTIG